MVSKKKPDFVFLMETKVARIHAERVRVKIGYEGLFYVNNTGRSGGLALLWRKNNTARLLGYSKTHIDVEVSISGFPNWRMTCYYGYPERTRRTESWDLLKQLATQSELPWVVIGDFNDLLYQYEKRGGNPHPNSLLRGFGETMDQCGLAQLPMSGNQFTWQTGKGTPGWIQEKLDKVLVTNRWRDIVNGATVANQWTRRSDHSAIFMGIRQYGGRRAGGRRFRFEMAWLYDEGCRAVVAESWEEGRDRGAQGSDLCRVEMQEDAYWKQRAKQHWLKDADANTKFYHRYASNRRNKNTLVKIMNDSGEWMEGDDMAGVVLDYFKRIFTTNNPVSGDLIYNNVTPRVTRAQNEVLMRPFEVGEVKDALFEMYPDKAPGPDGMNPGFYQSFWDIVGGDISAFVVDCLNTNSLPPGLNNTDVVLIPKKDVPEQVTDLRPIALSNVIYRIMAKMITRRMKPLMDSIISESQSAFIPGRLITDNILIASEVGHYLNRKQCGVVGWGALKLDMAKAYDRMEWPFLKGMMMALGFNDKWIELIMTCVTTVSYNFLAQEMSLIHGCRVARGAPPISHLFFADDSLLFFKATVQEANEIKGCLALYESMSGQAVNYHKSSICYSKNTTEEIKENVAQAPNFGKYLGLPSFIGRNKKAAFAYIEDKIRQRIGSWNKKLLSQLMNRYWWGSGTDQKIHWKAWDKLCIPKKYGGLGFKDLRAFNVALLGKQVWRLLTNTDSLVSKVYKARYYPNQSFTDAILGNNPSHCWRSIMTAKSLICSGVRRRIGNGDSTFVWGHPWLQDKDDPMIQTEMPLQLSNARYPQAMMTCGIGMETPKAITRLNMGIGVWWEIMKILQMWDLQSGSHCGNRKYHPNGKPFYGGL
ncbi:PREDICTED: uncharacterized protein LOC109163041 [Ipomoea nil]|uniref:uncharacterized protein LOC109163041 n=1 Tax=Ipomoea nil TaxID=35883 RepID=UPI000900F81B|nr:PREDICTED: uncharacterized protein LOC109163041 [Ipomoea nil]